MSDDDTRMGDLHELPACAPRGLKALCRWAEGVIQTQIQLLGSATPSKAPNSRELLKNNGIAKPDDQSVLIDHYDDHKEGMDKAMSGLQWNEKGVGEETLKFGGEVTTAYGSIGAAVAELNKAIDDSHKRVRTVTDSVGKPVLDAQGNPEKELPREVTNGLFNGIWRTLDKTSTVVNGITDQAAAAALSIRGEEPSSIPANVNTGGGTPVSYPSAGYSGGPPPMSPAMSRGIAPQFNSGPVAAANIPAGEKPTAMAMMKYLIDKYGLNPEQAAAIVANAKHESGFRVDAVGDNGTAKGLFQWRLGRQAAFLDFADNPGESVSDWRTHIDFMMHELRSVNAYQPAEDSLNDPNKSAGQKAADFDRYYEISTGSTTGARAGYAEGLAKEWRQQPQSSSSVAV
ncbi:phage tail tip lysozyme [Nocardia sp. NPDC049149]|uniref:phage tail tip lysozyme n=1 Tax=Nocardia sp. NPDC049149 TaxID=3364315 RepID=UPI003719B812